MAGLTSLFYEQQSPPRTPSAPTLPVTPCSVHSFAADRKHHQFSPCVYFNASGRQTHSRISRSSPALHSGPGRPSQSPHQRASVISRFIWSRTSTPRIHKAFAARLRRRLPIRRAPCLCYHPSSTAPPPPPTQTRASWTLGASARRWNALRNPSRPPADSYGGERRLYCHDKMVRRAVPDTCKPVTRDSMLDLRRVLLLESC